MVKKSPVILAIVFLLAAGTALAKEDFEATSQSTLSLCPCSKQSYDILIKNTGDKTSIYSVKQSSGQNWAYPYSREFTLKPGQKTKIPVIVNSSCNALGASNFSFIVSTKSGLRKEIRQQYKFKMCYDYVIQKGQILEDFRAARLNLSQYNGTYSICEGESRFIPVIFKNNDKTIDNSYSLRLDAERWAGINTNNFRLGKNKAGAIIVSLNPPEGSKGNYHFKLESHTSLGLIKKGVGIDVNVEKCHSVEVELDKNNDEVCSGDKKSYALLLKNAGLRDERVNLSLDAPGWVNIGQDAIELPANSEREVSLGILPPPDESGKFIINVTASIEGSDISKSKTLHILATPKKDCYKGAIIMSDRLKNAFSLDFVPFKIKNSGLRATTYAIAIDGPEWISAEPRGVELTPGQVWNANIRIEPPGGINEDIYKATLKLTANGMEYTKPFEIIVKRKNPVLADIGKFFIYYRYYFYLAAAILFVLFLLREPIRTALSKEYRIKKSRLKALEKAREARRKKKLENREF